MKQKSVIAILCLILVGISIMSIIPSNIPNEGTERIDTLIHSKAVLTNNYEERDPIRIDGNENFEKQNWPGSGSEEDPWIIDGYKINAEEKGNAIYIGNVTDHFVIRDCYLYNSSGNEKDYFSNTGLYLYNVENGTIKENHIENNEEKGIWVRNSADTKIVDNVFQKHYLYYALRVDNSVKNYISENQLLDGYRGIYLNKSSIENEIVNNHVEGNDYGISLVDANQNMVNSNTAVNNTVGIQIYD